MIAYRDSWICAGTWDFSIAENKEQLALTHKPAVGQAGELNNVIGTRQKSFLGLIDSKSFSEALLVGSFRRTVNPHIFQKRTAADAYGHNEKRLA